MYRAIVIGYRKDKKREITKVHEAIFDMINMFIILIKLMASWSYVKSKT